MINASKLPLSHLRSWAKAATKSVVTPPSMEARLASGFGAARVLYIRPGSEKGKSCSLMFHSRGSEGILFLDLVFQIIFILNCHNLQFLRALSRTDS